MQAYDPEATKIAKGIFGSKITYAETSYEALTGADAMALVTEWSEFREPDYDRMRKMMRTPVIFDGRNIYGAGNLPGAWLHVVLDGTAVTAHVVPGCRR